ncbi:MAG: aspartate-semialdehyde dehydrogenase [Deltaproteobacteria bacterium]|nr:aspartate-semialdehyde dehydrogenase [Deltaproteobacteria bacterium]
MRKQPVIAIAGATGLVGNEMLAVLEQLDVPCQELRLFASDQSAGEVYSFRDHEVSVEVLSESSFEGVDIALFATSASLSEKFVPLAAQAGAVAIDNSSHFRMKPEVPLVVPEVNADILSAEDKIIANPNCSTIQLVPVLNVIHRHAGLRRVVVSTYQSVSGAGKSALDELWAQTLAIFNQKDVPIEAFQHQIAFNCIPQIDVILDNGYTKEEFKIINESRKILRLPELKITATAVRVPVFHSHAESVNVETERELTPGQLAELLASEQGIEVYPNFLEYPMQLKVASTDNIHVGRIRKDDSVDHGLDMWVVADNVRKGAALNAVQIAQYLLQKFGS